MATAKPSSWLQHLSKQLYQGLYVALAAAVAVYGNGQADLITLTFNSTKVNRPFTNVGLVCWAINVLLFLYVYGWLRGVRKVYQPLRLVPWAMQLGAATFGTAFVSFTVGLWPLYSILSPVVVMVTTYGFINALNLLPFPAVDDD